MKIPEIKITITYKGAKKSELLTLDSFRKTADTMRTIFNDGTIHWTEEMIMLCLNHARNVIGYYRVSMGGTNSTLADPRVIATIALNTCASYVILAHNHPSGSLKPSDADKQITSRIKDGLQLLDIKLMDHIIVTDEGYFSFADEGIL